jgi:outer membrane murein-binding lipoprotein Lpp
MGVSTHEIRGGLPRVTRRGLSQLLGVAAAALAVGGVAGYFTGHAVGDNSSKVNALNAQLNALNAQVGSLRAQAPQIIATAHHQATQELASARSQIASERQKASASVASAHGQVAGAQAHLKSLQGQISGASHQLAQLQSQINGAQATIAKDTIQGTGTFVVGSDINPGTYRAAASPGCYWARLASLDNSNIIDNNNADGPVVVQILASDKAFEDNGCADFHRIGP